MRIIYSILNENNLQYLYGHDIFNNNKIPFRFLNILITRIETLNSMYDSSAVGL